MGRMNAEEARKKAKRAASAKKTAKRKANEAEDRVAQATVVGLLSTFSAKIDGAIKAAVREGDTSVHCYLGSWDWSDPRSRGAPTAAQKIAFRLKKDGYEAGVKVNSAYRHVDGDGCPTDYDNGSTGVSIEIDWSGRSSEDRSDDD